MDIWRPPYNKYTRERPYRRYYKFVAIARACRMECSLCTESCEIFFRFTSAALFVSRTSWLFLRFVVLSIRGLGATRARAFRIPFSHVFSLTYMLLTSSTPSSSSMFVYLVAYLLLLPFRCNCCCFGLPFFHAIVLACLRFPFREYRSRNIKITLAVYRDNKKKSVCNQTVQSLRCAEAHHWD